MMLEQKLTDDMTQNLTPSLAEGVSPMEISDTIENDETYDLCRQLIALQEELEKTQREKQQILQQIEENKKRRNILLRLTAVTVIIAAICHFHLEMGQVGWNWMHSVAVFLDTTPQNLSGLLVFSAVMYLLWSVLKWTVHSAIEDLMAEEESDDDLDYR